MIDQIRAVLDKWDYSKALELYQASGTNPSLAKLLSSGETLFFRKKLKSELDQLLTKLSVEKAESKEEARGLSPLTGGCPEPVEGRGVLSDYPLELEKTITRRNLAIRRQDFLRGQLQLMKPGGCPSLGKVDPTKSGTEGVFQLCREILDLDDELNACWKIIHYFNEHGQLPPDEIDEILNKAITWMDLFRIHSNYKVNVSKAKSGKLPADKRKFYEAVLHRTESILNKKINRTMSPLQGGAQRAGGDEPLETYELDKE